MISVDTNIVLRLLLEDDPTQLAAAQALMERHELWVAHGVLMEAEWVLRSFYKWSRARFCQVIADFLSLPRIRVAGKEDLLWALDRHAAGADWADMLHVIASRNLEAFATFEIAMAKAAGAAPPVPVVVIP
ncbi:MAG: type II toxin-antitoxin system VapC family toxin [Allosphingosinicella sp.]|uniref:type II toxin-antitoxin system VapC family toxin n=1 Tax=Allosphingosinicella sp. TaxID=2823234 RepID=UPI00395D3F73